MVNLGRFRVMFGVRRPLKVGGLRPSTFPGTSGMGSGKFFSILTLPVRKLKKCSFQGLDFLFRSFLFVRWGLPLAHLLPRARLMCELLRVDVRLAARFYVRLDVRELPKRGLAYSSDKNNKPLPIPPQNCQNNKPPLQLYGVILYDSELKKSFWRRGTRFCSLERGRLARRWRARRLPRSLGGAPAPPTLPGSEDVFDFDVCILGVWGFRITSS